MTMTIRGKVTIHGLGSLGSGLPGLWAPEITGLPGLPNRNLLSVFEAVKDLLNRNKSELKE